MLHLEGRTLGGCKLIRKIGEGGMGEVYLGEQIRVGNRAVAVKVVRADDDALATGTPSDIEERFRREAATIGGFSHPNILPVHDSGVEDGYLYLVMQYAPDGSLADAIKGRSAHPLALPASLAFTTDLIGQVADALQYTHDRGVVHRDVKPGNVLIRVEPNGHWHAMLADFGVARAMETSSQKTQVTGTLAYMAPEQFNGKFFPATDQYALAIMTYQLLGGRVPFEGDLPTISTGHIYGTPPSLRALNPSVPAAVEAVVMRGLAKDPGQRYPSVAAFATALKEAAGQPAGVAIADPAPRPGAGGPPPTWPVPEKPKQSGSGGLGRVWLTALAAVVLLVAVIGGGGLVLARQQRIEAQATQTALAIKSATAGPQATRTVAPTRTPVQIPTATATPASGDDVTTPPPAPDGVASTPTYSSLVPSCDGVGPGWQQDLQTSVSCEAIPNYVQITAQSTDQLGCIDQRNVTLADGYVSVLADLDQKGAVLAFRQAQGAPLGDGSFYITGYFFRVDASQQYAFYRTDSDGKATTLDSGSFNVKLAQHVALGVRFSGSAITLYVNGQKIADETDTTYTQAGWMALCSNGVAGFRAAQLYPLAS